MSSFCLILASLTFMMSSDAFNLKVFPAGDRCTLKVALSNIWTHPAAFNDFKDFGISSFDFQRPAISDCGGLHFHSAGNRNSSSTNWFILNFQTVERPEWWLHLLQRWRRRGVTWRRLRQTLCSWCSVKKLYIAMNTKIQLYLNCFPEICCTQLFLVNMNICLCRYRDY